MEYNQKNKNAVTSLAQKYDLAMLVLFGSYADNTMTKHSDLDFAYSKQVPLSFDDELSLGAELGRLFKNENVDVVHLNKTSPVFMSEIMKKAVLLFARTPNIFPNAFSYAMKRMQENRFLYDLKLQRLREYYNL
ncbi:MAG: hypothetical protein RL536_649 [Candidatus Parcubacteria bacterium]|jgi:predicted nucleotidyltransferase